MRIALVVLISLAATPAFADALTFVGRLDDRLIQVELTEPAHGAVAGRYTFVDDGADIPLRPVSVEGNVWTLAEEAPCALGNCMPDDNGVVADPPIAATWEITYDGNSFIGMATRTPAAAKATPEPFELSVLAARKFADQPTALDLHDRSVRLSYDETLPLDWKHAPYELHLLETDLSSTGEVMESGGIAWEYTTDPRTGLTFPRILPMDPGIEPVSLALDAHFYRMMLSALDCKAFRYGSYGVNEFALGLGGHTGGYEDEQVTLTHLSPTLVSWTQSGSLYCQGAHPYNHLDSYTLDARTGEPLDWRKVFSALSGPENAPSTALIAFIQQNRPADLFDAELDELCASDRSIAEQLRMRVVAGEEIMFTLSGFPHVSSVCNGDLFSASLDELTPFLAETASDYFPVLAR